MDKTLTETIRLLGELDALIATPCDARAAHIAAESAALALAGRSATRYEARYAAGLPAARRAVLDGAGHKAARAAAFAAMRGL